MSNHFDAINSIFFFTNSSSPGSLVLVCEQAAVAGLLVSGRVGTLPDLGNNLMSKP